jgi:ABC-type branched-subunit amino acid transport system ATPase component
MGFLFGLADHVSVIHWGQVIARGTDELRQSVGGVRAWPERGGSAAAAGGARGEAMLAVEGIDAFYGETQALFGVSLAVGAGEVVACSVPTARARRRAARDPGLTPACRGAIRFDGRDITGRRRTRSRAEASAGCRTTAGSSRR